MPSPLDQLTEPQRECLRLVLSHHNSKEIAHLLRVSPSAVDKRIERAVQQIGAPSRFAAARQLALYEGRQGDDVASERLPSDPIDVPNTLAAAPTMAQDEPWWIVRRLLGISPRSRTGRGPRNILSVPQRLALIVALVFIISLSSMALLNMGQTLSSVLKRPASASSRH